MDNLPGTDVPRGEAVLWLKKAGPVYLLFGLAGIAVTLAAASADLLALIISAAAAGLASLLLGARLKELRELGSTATVLRVAVALAHLVIGLLLVLVADSDSATFIGIAFLAHFATELLSEARYSRRWMVTRGYLGYALAVLLILLGLGPIGAIAPPGGLALVAFGVVVAAVATELHTEDWLDVHRTGETRTLLLRGAFALVGTAVALLVFGVEPAYVAIIVVGLIAVVALVASDSDTGMLLVLGLVALVWALAPRAHEVPPATQPEPGDELIVAFGDSYISGEGATEFIEGTNETNPERGNQCRRAPTAYPVTLVEQSDTPEVPDRVLFLACSGAVARDLWAGRPNGTEPVPQLRQYRDAMSSGDRGHRPDARSRRSGRHRRAGVDGRQRRRVRGDRQGVHRAGRLLDGRRALRRSAGARRRAPGQGLHGARGGDGRRPSGRGREPARVRDGLPDARGGGRLLVDAPVVGGPRLHPRLRRRSQRHRQGGGGGARLPLRGRGRVVLRPGPPADLRPQHAKGPRHELHRPQPCVGALDRRHQPPELDPQQLPPERDRACGHARHRRGRARERDPRRQQRLRGAVGRGRGHRVSRGGDRRWRADGRGSARAVRRADPGLGVGSGAAVDPRHHADGRPRVRGGVVGADAARAARPAGALEPC